MLARVVIFAFTLLLISNASIANPVGGEVTAGDATITNSGNLTQINQTSQKAVVNWQSFNIQAGEQTHFQQPTGGIALNRISPTQGPSQIFGQLSATGKIILVNQAGVFFGPGAQVNVGGIIASTSNITDQNFLAGKLTFDQASPYGGSIINQGSINTADHGLVALMGTGVVNNGMISAHLGNVVLASGNKFTVDLNGDQLINFSIDEAATRAGVDQNGNTLKNGVHNDGSIIADGGTILVTGKAASGVVDQVINMEGVVKANSVYKKRGAIILSANDGNVIVKGKLIASGKKGGKIKVLGKTVVVKSTAVLDASGKYGGGEILVGGNYQGKGSEYNALQTSVELGAFLKADAVTSGNGGKIIVWSDGDTLFNGNISARGGALKGNGGFAETSGHYLDVNGSYVDLRAPLGNTGLWLLDPTDVIISNAANSNLTTGGATYQPTDGTQATTIINASSLATALNYSNIQVTTTPLSGSGGSGSGDISVNSTLTWIGATTLTLNALNNININADISAINGGLTLVSGKITTIPANINVGTGLSITASNGFNDITGNISGTGSVTLSSQVFNFTGNNTYSGGTFLNNATIYYNNENNFGATSGDLTLVASTLYSNNSVTFNSNRDFILTSGLNLISPVNTSDTITINGQISGSGGMRVQDLTLGSTNTYTGQTQISGSFNYNAINAISASSHIFLFDSAAVEMNDFSSTVLGIDGVSGSTFNLGSNSNTRLTIDSSNFGSSFDGAITGAGSITKTNVGQQSFTSGLNSYSGSTTITAGTLRISSDHDLGTAPSTPTVDSIMISGGTLNMASSMTLNANRGMTVSNASTLRVNTSGGIVGIYNGIIKGTGTLALIGDAGVGSLNIGGTNTFSGNTSISGRVIINSNEALGQSSSPQTVSINTGATLVTSQTFNLSANKSLLVQGTTVSISPNAGTTLGILGTIDKLSGTANLNFTGAGSVNIGGVVGGINSLNSLITQSTLANVNLANNITTSGAQTYNSPTTVGVGTVPILSTTNSPVTFANTLNGPGGLDIRSGTGAINFNNSVGTTTGLASITDNLLGASSRTITFSGAVGSSLQSLGSLIILGNAVINGGAVYTSGAQAYSRSVTLGADTVISTGSSVSFSDLGISGVGHNLSLQGTGSSGNTFTIGNNVSVNNVTISGGTGQNTLTINSGASTQTWSVTGGNSGNITGISTVTGAFEFSTVQNLIGGINTDNFTLNGGTVSGSVDGGLGANTLTANNVSNTWTLTGINTGTVTGTGGFSNIQNLIGGTDTDSFTLTGGTLSGTINGAAGTNTLTGDNLNNSWTITASNAGVLTGIGGFSSIQNLIGGTSNDSFAFNNGVSISGDITGNGGTNTLDLSAYSTDVNIDLAAATATAIGGSFTNLNSFIGGSGNNTITAVNVNNTWNITGNDSGNINSNTSFSAFGNLTGGSDNDNFVLSNGVEISGNISGNAGGTNTLDLSAYSTDVNIDLAAATATAIGGGFTDLNSFIGGSGNNTITAVNVNNTWNITGNNSGNINSTTSFSAFSNLTGGSDNDNFILNNGAEISGNVSGNGGVTNTLSYTTYGNPVIISLETNSATGIGNTFSGITNFVGYDADTTLTGANVSNTWNILSNNAGNINSTITFASVRNLIGGSDNDTFMFGAGTLVNGNVSGGSAGTNTLNLSAYTTSVIVNLENSTATGIGGTFSNISNFVGTGDTLSTFVGPSTTNNIWNIYLPNIGNVNTFTNFDGFGNISGSTLSDTNNFMFTAIGAISGNVIGGSIQDTLDFTGLLGSPQVDVTLTGAGINHGYAGTTSAVIGGTFDNIDIINNTVSLLNSLTGPNAQTTWRIGNTANSGTVNDSASTQSLTYSNFSNIIGQGTDNTLEDTVGGRNWSISGANSGSIDGAVQSFVGMQALQNSGASNNFIFDDGQNFNGTIGGSGDDVLNYSAHSVLNPIEATLSGSNAGTIAAGGVTTSFTGIASIDGSAGDDSFNFITTSAFLSGNIAGNGGLDTISGFSLDSTFLINLTNNTSSKLGGNFSDIENFIGTANSALDSTLIGPSNNNIWTINASNTGDINGVYTFERFGNITGGSTSLSNIFNFTNTGGISGNVIGGNTSDTLDFTGLSGSPNINVALNNLGTTHGYTGTAQSTIGLIFDNIDFIFNTSASNNTLTGANRNTNWTFTGANTGNLTDNGGGNTLYFSGFNNIVGGASNDNFNFINNSTLGGTLDGGDTTSLNQLNFSAYPDMETVTLADPVLNVIDTGVVKNSLSGLVVDFSRIQSFTGDGLSLVYPPSNSHVQFTNPNHLDGIIYVVSSLPFTFINAKVYVPNNGGGGGGSNNKPSVSIIGLDQVIYEMINPLAVNYYTNTELDIIQNDQFERTMLKCMDYDHKNLRLCNKINVFSLSKNHKEL